jgi:hypothetical protein
MANSVRIKVITEEIDKITTLINSVRQLNVQILGFGLAGAITILTYGLQENSYEIFIVIPYVLLGILFYNSLFLSGVFSLAGYKRYLENELNKELDEQIIKWELIAKKYIRTPLISIGINAMYVVFFFSTIFLLSSNWDTYTTLFKNALILSYALWAVLSILLIITLIRINRLDDKVFVEFEQIS